MEGLKSKLDRFIKIDFARQEKKSEAWKALSLEEKIKRFDNLLRSKSNSRYYAMNYYVSYDDYKSICESCSALQEHSQNSNPQFPQQASGPKPSHQ